MTGEELMARPSGALISELAAAWRISGSATAFRLTRGMAAGTIFRATHLIMPAKRYFLCQAARDQWMATAGRTLTTPIQALAQQMIADGRAYLTAMELAEQFDCKVQLATNALSRMAGHGALHKVSEGRRMFFFIDAAAAARYPRHLIERHAAELIRKAAQRNSPPTPAQNRTIAGKQTGSKLGGEMIIPANVKRTYEPAPPPRFAPEPGYRGAFMAEWLERRA